MTWSIRMMFNFLASRESQEAYESLPREDVVVASGPVELAVSSTGERLVLVPIPATTDVMPDRKSAGVHLERLTVVRSDGEHHFMAIRCRKPHLNAMFELVAEDLLGAFKAHAADPVAAARRVLGLWRELLAKDPTRYPSPSTLRGLYGELWVLRELVARDVPDAVEIWSGPLSTQQGVHDFSGAGNALEVKAITQRTELAVTINSIEQLEAPEGGRLALTCLVLEELPSDGERIRDVVDGLRASGVGAVPLLQRIHARGVDFTYLQADDVPGFRVLAHHTWWVDQHFPRLTASSLGDLRPPEVTALSYRLDLTARVPDTVSDEGWNAVLGSLAP